MHPYISQALAAERVRDLHSQATNARRRQLVRQAARGQRDRPRHGEGAGADAAGQLADTYADFLLMTRGQLRCEPSAAQRARGAAVR
jgi:hypothetical protein